jgi:hypothetical protein
MEVANIPLEVANVPTEAAKYQWRRLTYIQMVAVMEFGKPFARGRINLINPLNDKELNFTDVTPPIKHRGALRSGATKTRNCQLSNGKNLF